MAEVLELQRLSPEQVVEAANGVLTARLSIEDPAMAAQRVIELAGLDPAKAQEIEALAREAAKSDPELLGRLLVGALNDMAESEPASRAAIEDAAEAAGAKQTVVGLDVLILGFLVLCGYIAVKTGGVAKEERTARIEEQADGKLAITIGYTTTYVSPFAAVGKLIGSIWPKP